MSRDVFILGGKRTPMGRICRRVEGYFRDRPGRSCGERLRWKSTGVAPEEIDHTVIGNALQTSGDAIYGARHVASESRRAI